MKAKKMVVRILFCVLALALCVVLIDVVKMGFSYHNNHKQTTTAVTTDRPSVTTAIRAPDPEPAEKAFDIAYEEYDGYIKVTLDEMNANFKKFSSKYSRDIRERLTRIYNGLVKNIGLYKHYMSFCGYPDPITFINEKFVKPLGTLSFIKTIYAGDPDFYDYQEEYQSSCYAPEENGVYLLWEYYIEDDEMDLILAEEVVHAGQRDLDKIVDYGDYLILGEGEANIIAFMQKPFIDTENITFFFDHDDPDYICELHGVAHQQNILATRYYTYLTLLLGYQKVMEFRETGDCSVIEQALTEKYGIDGVKFYSDMFQSLIRCMYGYIFEDATEMFDAENEFLECFQTILRHVNTGKDTKAVFELYRYLCIQYGTNYMDYTENQDDGVDTTYLFIDRTEVEDSLYMLVYRYGVDFISNPKQMNREVFDAYIHPQIPKAPEAVPVSSNKKDLFYDTDKNLLIIRNTGKEDIQIPVAEHVQEFSIKKVRDSDAMRH